MGIILNKGQKRAVDIIVPWYRKGCEQIIEMSGGPGTGKTTIVKYITNVLGLDIQSEVLFVTYVGKASLQLRLSGVNAKTIHSTFYQLEKEYLYDEYNRPMRYANGRLMYKMNFVRKSYLPKRIKLIVIDEAGMVPDPILNDIKDYGLPILCIGDKDQLPPVFGSSSLFKNPDVVLTEIMRQAEGSPIIRIAQKIIKNEELDFGYWGQNCSIVDDTVLQKKKPYLSHDIIICARNSTRESINTHVRFDILNRKSKFPVVGDKLVCRKNNWQEELEDIPLTNGMFGYITNIDRASYKKDKINIDFTPDFLDDAFEDIPMDLTYLFATHEDRQSGAFFGNGNLFEYAYAATCQLAQGSQYDNVMVIDEDSTSHSDYHRRWLYTAVTRAKYGLTIVRKRPKFFIKPLYKKLL